MSDPTPNEFRAVITRVHESIEDADASTFVAALGVVVTAYLATMAESRADVWLTAFNATLAHNRQQYAEMKQAATETRH